MNLFQSINSAIDVALGSDPTYNIHLMQGQSVWRGCEIWRCFQVHKRIAIKVWCIKSIQYSIIWARDCRICDWTCCCWAYCYCWNSIWRLYFPCLWSNSKRGCQVQVSLRRAIPCRWTYNPSNLGCSRTWCTLPLSIPLGIFCPHSRS